MGGGFSNLASFRCVDVFVFWEQRNQVLLGKYALTPDELEDLVREWQWLSFTVRTDGFHPKSHLSWIMLAIKFYRGWKVF